jgi:hypothetical protein
MPNTQTHREKHATHTRVSNAELQQEMKVQMSAFAAMNAAKTGKANF